MRGSLFEELVPILKQEYPGMKMWKSFAQWWLLAHGLDFMGKEKDYCVDGSGDGGFDILAWPLPGFNDEYIRVIQSKYYKSSPNLSNLSRFVEAVDAIKGSRPQFNLWIDTVSDKLRPSYVKLREKNSSGRVKFVFITTATLKKEVKRFLEKMNIEVNERDDIRKLMNSYKRGHTPRIEKLYFTPTSKVLQITQTDKVKMYVFSVHLKEFAKAFHKHDNHLFAGNIRYGLRGENASKVREGINHTLLEHDKEFVFSHNGITMVAQQLTRIGKKITLIKPSVVNGAQTISYIGQKWLNKIEHTKAEVLVKLVEVCPQASFEELETDIAIRSNTQIKVDFSDLIVSEPSLVTLQRHLLRKRVHLERKKGDQPLSTVLLRITKERLVQILSCLDKQLGPTAPKRLQDLFKKHNAVELIRHYVDENRVNEVIALIWLYKLLIEVNNGYANQKSRKRGQIAAYAIFTSTVNALKKAKKWHPLVHQLAAQEDYWNFDRNAEVEGLIKACRGHMLRFSKRAKRNEPAFYKNKEQTNEAVKKVTKKIMKIARNIS